jgi:hypothetical protein
MGTHSGPDWEHLDPEVRGELDDRYRHELDGVVEPGLTEEGVAEYLEYRHERPEGQITTYEEGQIRRMLRGKFDASAVPDPVELEPHTGRIENFGAHRLHLTNFGTWLFILLAHVYLGLVGLLIWLVVRS